MKTIYIGQNANGQPLYLTPEMRKSTHMHVIGSSGTGKSKFLEWLIRKDLRAGQGFCLLDWHGELYNNILRYCAKLRIGLPLGPANDHRTLILLNPSKPDFVTGFNPFMNRGGSISVQVANRVDATIKPWGMENTDATPTLEKVLKIIYTFAVAHQQPLHNVRQLLRFKHDDLREYARNVVNDPFFQEELEELQMTKTFRDWRDLVQSTSNRLGRFLGSEGVRRFLGLSEHNINLREIMDKGHILLVNLGASQFLDRESAKVFASLFLTEFFETGMVRANELTERGEKPNGYILYLDEFQNYITQDIADMLDQIRKGGLHMVLAHQHLAHLEKSPTLLQSVITNARLRAVFGGNSYNEASFLTNEMFLPDLNSRQIEKAYYHTIHLYEKQYETIRSSSTTRGRSTSLNETMGSGSASGFVSSTSNSTSSTMGFSAPGTSGSPNSVEGWFSQGETMSRVSASAYSDVSSDFSASGFATSDSEAETVGETVVPVWVPIPVQELGSEDTLSLEEKRSKVAQMLKCQQTQHCFIKLDTELTQPMKVPFVTSYSVSPDSLLEYEQAIYAAQGALSAATVDLIIAESQTKFLADAQQAVGSGPVIELAPDRIEEVELHSVRKLRARPKKPTSNPYDAVPSISKTEPGEPEK